MRIKCVPDSFVTIIPLHYQCSIAEHTAQHIVSVHSMLVRMIRENSTVAVGLL